MFTLFFSTPQNHLKYMIKHIYTIAKTCFISSLLNLYKLKEIILELNLALKQLFVQDKDAQV